MYEILEGEHIILRKAKEDDYKSMMKNVWGDPEVYQWMLFQPTLTEEEAIVRCRRSMEFQKDHYAYFIADKETDEAFGHCAIKENEPGRFEEAGIGIAAKYQGKGYGKEVVALLLDLAFNKLGAIDFTYGYFQDNVRSKKVAEYFGFEYDHTYEMTRPWDGALKVIDSCVLTRDKYFIRLQHGKTAGNVITSAHSVKKINLGQSGADVFELDEALILKHVVRERIDHGMFDTYVKEALFYQYACPKSYLPEVSNIEINPNEIILVMKKYGNLDRSDYNEELLRKIANVLACIHSEPIPEFLAENEMPSNMMSDDDIVACVKGWYSVLDEHPGVFDRSQVETISQNINDLISWHDSEKRLLSHGDFHWDNLLTDDKGAMIVCDWQSVGVRGASADLSFFMSRLSADGISVDSHCFLKWYTLEYNRLTGDAVSADELERHMKAANVITSFRFWHHYLHGNDTERVRGIYDKMVSDYLENR